MLERVVHAIAPVRYLKNRIITLLKRFIDSKLIAKYSQVIFYTFESAKQLQARKS